MCKQVRCEVIESKFKAEDEQSFRCLDAFLKGI